MSTKKKMLQAAAGNAGGAGLDVEDVFSTYLYEGNASTQTITNGIDLDGEGGMVWLKSRSANNAHEIDDTERGVGKLLTPNSNAAEVSESEISAFNSNGFDLRYQSGRANADGEDIASWTFRKAPKFFDVVTYTGSGGDQTISHNLGSAVGSVLVKRLDSAQNWCVWHRGVHSTSSESDFLRLNTTDADTAFGAPWIESVSSSSFTIKGSYAITNETNATYVAYLFAHNDGDGDFGPDGDADIIKCGSYTGNGSSDGPEIDLGFEPQWVMIKAAENVRTDTSNYNNWGIYDNMRGLSVVNSDTALAANTSDAEGSGYLSGSFGVSPTPEGFKITTGESMVNYNGCTYIYIAIRRGTKVPESGTEVFDVDVRDDTDAPMYKSGFVTDFSLYRDAVASDDWRAQSRLTGKLTLFPNKTDAESSIYNETTWDFMNGFHEAGSINAGYLSWMWKRAPNFFDVVAYTGDGVAGRTVSHNLGVAPEMMWVKHRESSGNPWMVYHSGIAPDAETDALFLNATDAAQDLDTYWNDTAPTASSFTVGSGGPVNFSNYTYIAYLFASLDGVSKVGSYTGNGSSQTIDCGFTSGARFILVKRTDSTGDWYVWDTERGIVAGNDPYLELNTTDAEVTSTDWVDPDNSGFIVNGTTINASGGDYIFYAIA